MQPHTEAKSNLSLQRVGLAGTGTNLTVPGYIVNKVHLLRLLYYKVIHSCNSSKNVNLLFTDIAGSSTKLSLRYLHCNCLFIWYIPKQYFSATGMKSSIAYLKQDNIPAQLATVRVQPRPSVGSPATAHPTAPASPGCSLCSTASALWAHCTQTCFGSCHTSHRGSYLPCLDAKTQTLLVLGPDL